MKLVKNFFLLFSDKLKNESKFTNYKGLNEDFKNKKIKRLIILKKGLAPDTLKEGDVVYDASNKVLGKYSSIN